MQAGYLVVQHLLNCPYECTQHWCSAGKSLRDNQAKRFVPNTRDDQERSLLHRVICFTTFQSASKMNALESLLRNFFLETMAQRSIASNYKRDPGRQSLPRFQERQQTLFRRKTSEKKGVVSRMRSLARIRVDKIRLHGYLARWKSGLYEPVSYETADRDVGIDPCVPGLP